MRRLSPAEIARRWIAGDDLERRRIDEHLERQRQLQVRPILDVIDLHDLERIANSIKDYDHE